MGGLGKKIKTANDGKSFFFSSKLGKGKTLKFNLFSHNLLLGLKIKSHLVP